ncbi:hypothetical protein HPB47_025575 [Ixodes persulcatus]|uniref:Uncharacterized protein n=1 Tax=Ixodes persulcatus TaxID=34615 RepID=A0AC60Q1I8_IXOPE|nr:hypothetical protein HPB47_025575 [Ixodes persulcatus]
MATTSRRGSDLVVPKWDLREVVCSVPVVCVLCLLLASAASFVLAWSPFFGFLVTVGSVFGLALVTRPVGSRRSVAFADDVLPKSSSTPSFVKSPTPPPEAEEQERAPASRSATIGALGLSRQHIIHLRNIYQRHHGGR